MFNLALKMFLKKATVLVQLRKLKEYLEAFNFIFLFTIQKLFPILYIYIFISKAH